MSALQDTGNWLENIKPYEKRLHHSKPFQEIDW